MVYIDTVHISFDAKSLFTYIPFDRAIDHICNIIPSDKIPFTIETFAKLLKLACCYVPFLFQEGIYEQFDGMVIGSNLASTFANFSMDLILWMMNSQNCI